MHKRYRTTLATAAVTALTGGLMTVAAGSAVAAGSLQGDYNNDGYRDIVASANSATVNGRAGAGQVVVYWGGPTGLESDRRSPISQASAGVPGAPEQGDGFGSMTTTGDLNGDGVSDLVIAASREDVGNDVNGGMVTVLWGSDAGLVSGAVISDPDENGHDRFGQSLATGDFDADGTTDLAVGSDHPAVDILAGGLGTWGEPASPYTIHPSVAPGFEGTFFLTAGQVDGAGTGDDLVVNGLEATPNADGYIYNKNFYFEGVAGEGLGGSGVKLPGGIITDIGDTDGDGYGDLVIGTEWDEHPDSTKGGQVSILHGNQDGPYGPILTVTQDSRGIVGGSETDDRFGGELHLGDVNGDGFQDLVIGSYAENLSGDWDTGAVHLIYGSPAGLTPTGAQYFNQETAGIPGSSEDQDYFGSDVFLSDVNGDGNADLTIGAYGENWFNGAVTALTSNGAKIVTDDAEWLGAYASGISTAGQPGLGVNFTG